MSTPSERPSRVRQHPEIEAGDGSVSENDRVTEEVVVLPTTERRAVPRLPGADGGEWARLPRCRLIVVSGPDEGKVFAPTTQQIVMGSQPSADVVLSDGAVSRFHCEIVLGDLPTIRDLGSANGTLVNNVLVLQARLESPAEISIGKTKLRFEYAPGELSIPLSRRVRLGSLVGQSPAMRAVFATLEQAAQSDATVLIEGETGTGKEVSAEAIHSESHRRDQPFVVIDCGALPPQLLESELFGHERGSFTGAVVTRTGAFEAATGGTLFLDEIGELSLELQPKLLRALERKEVKRVGTNAFKPVDVRLIAATNRNLRAEVTARRFRNDLYYRLAVLQVRLPALRERVEDLPLLVEEILGRLGVKDNPETERFRTKSFQAELQRHPWQGNVRELRNYIERCLVTRSEERPPSPAMDHPGGHDEPTVDVSMSLKRAREQWVNQLEKRYLSTLLEEHDHRVAAVARAAGVSRIYLYRLLWKHGLKQRESEE